MALSCFFHVLYNRGSRISDIQHQLIAADAFEHEFYYKDNTLLLIYEPFLHKCSVLFYAVPDSAEPAYTVFC